MARPRNIEREENEARGSVQDDLFVTWTKGDAQGKARAMRMAGHALANEDGVVRRSTAAFYDQGDGTAVRQGMNRRDYATFRPGEGKPRRPRDIIWSCMRAYDEFGIVRNIIDTMSDFCVQGISLSHPHPRTERFYQAWFKKVLGPDVSEHIANTLFLCANAPVRRHTAKLRQKDVDNLKKGFAAEGLEPPTFLGRKEVPSSYTIMNPVQIVVLGGDLVPFIGPSAFTFAVEVPQTVGFQVRRPKNSMERQLVDRLPRAVRQAIQDGMNVIPLDSQDMTMLAYKRRHWQVWATPMTYPLLDDLNMLRKLKMADLAALDSAISHIRIWKLGSLEHEMMPTRRAVQKLADMLANAGNGNGIDLIWGPDLELQETSTEIHRFLGEGKYVPHLAAIFAGYGIPPTLVGAAVQGGMTNNFISLKTLTERLQYVRGIVQRFWEHECMLVQQAMGFRLPAIVRFDRMVLTDEAAEKLLLIQLADRDLISVETLQERFGEDPVLELLRQRREQRSRKNDKMPQKAGAFHNPQTDHDLKRQLLQTGLISPSQAGVDLGPAKPGDKSLLDHQNEQQTRQATLQMQAQQQQADHDFRTQKLHLKHGVHPGQVANEEPAAKPAAKPGRKPGPPAAIKRPGQPGQGRPTGQKDTRQRKQKNVKLRTRAALAWSMKATDKVAGWLARPYLASLGKKTMAEVGPGQVVSFEKLLLAVLVHLPAGEQLKKQDVARALASPLPVPLAVSELWQATLESYQNEYKAEPDQDKIREFTAKVVALYRA